MKDNKLNNVYKNVATNAYTISNNSITDVKNFYKNVVDLVNEFNEFNSLYINKTDYKIDKDILSSYKNVVNVLFTSYKDNEIKGKTVDNIEVIKRYAFFVEMTNRISHIIESFSKKCMPKDNSVKKTKDLCYLIKEISIINLAKNTIGKENIGFISGITRDMSKTDNSYVYALDIPHYGQVSWHILDVDNFVRTLGKSEDELAYPFEIDKYANKKDLYGKRQSNIIHNDQILNNDYDSSEVGVHNMIDMKIPKGKENELKLALQIYEEIKRLSIDGNEKIEDSMNYDQYNVERRVKKACLKYGLPSKETFELLVNRVVEMVYKEQTYDKQLLRDWRDKEYESRNKPKSS